MASKKKTKKSKKASKKGAKPSNELVKEIGELLEKYHFTGAVTMDVAASSACPPGSSLQLVTRQTPSGKTVTRLECVQN